jgi:hypothetical protein
MRPTPPCRAVRFTVDDEHVIRGLTKILRREGTRRKPGHFPICDGPRGIVRPHTDMVSLHPSGRSDDVGTTAGAPS